MIIIANPRVEEIRERYANRPNHVIQEVFAAYDALTVERDRLRTALKQCGVLFVEIRGDWTDPRHECREGMRIVAAALAEPRFLDARLGRHGKSAEEIAAAVDLNDLIQVELLILTAREKTP